MHPQCLIFLAFALVASNTAALCFCSPSLGLAIVGAPALGALLFTKLSPWTLLCFLALVLLKSFRGFVMAPLLADFYLGLLLSSESSEESDSSAFYPL